MSILAEEFFHQPTETVAQNLLGKQLTRVWRGQKISGIIVETEAYLGVRDKAAHVYGGKKTERTKAFYLTGGHSYIYLIYGMYHCFNVVCGDETRPEAVLIRALEPTAGIEHMRKLRGQKKPSDVHLTSGPGKLCKALKIEKPLNGVRLFAPPIYLEDIGHTIDPTEIQNGPRIGVDYAEECRHWPLRFWLRDNRFVSRAS